MFRKINLQEIILLNISKNFLKIKLISEKDRRTTISTHTHTSARTISRLYPGNVTSRVRRASWIRIPDKWKRVGLNCTSCRRTYDCIVAEKNIFRGFHAPRSKTPRNKIIPTRNSYTCARADSRCICIENTLGCCDKLFRQIISLGSTSL